MVDLSEMTLNYLIFIKEVKTIEDAERDRKATMLMK